MSPTDVDKIISAQILDQDVDPVGYKVVLEYLVHGPYRLIKPNAPMQQTLFKKYQNNTIILEDGFLIYRKREARNVLIDAINGYGWIVDASFFIM